MCIRDSLPIGFFSALAFRRSARSRRLAFSAALSVCLGLMLSVSIEYLQIFLPSRYSSIIDVMSNTLGAGLGALCTVVIRTKTDNSVRSAAPF
jgi:VanZ family protein